jgi:prophage antirepressor-like protein
MTMNSITTPFQFGVQQVRVITDDQGEPWFVAADVCSALEIQNTADALKRLDDDEKGIDSIYTPGGQQQMHVVNESGLYSLILTSRKPSAKKFKKWITADVLPAIRKTGGYSIQQLGSSPAELLVMMAQQNLVHERRVAAVEEKVKLIEAQLPQEQDYFTVLGYGRFAGEVVSNNMAIAIGRRAAGISRARGVPVGDTTDPRYGFVHTYQADVLAEVFAEYCETA